MQVQLDHQFISLPDGARYLDAVESLYPKDPRQVFAVRVKGRTLPLNAPCEPEADALSIRLDGEEGRRIYERSLRFVLLAAIQRIAPAAKVRIENSTWQGIYFSVEGHKHDEAMAAHIEENMRDLVDADLPFEKTVLTRKDAIAYYESIGQTDKVRLLTYRPYEHFSVYRLGDMREYFYGEMAPSTGYVPVFAVHPSGAGLELMLPDSERPDRPAEQHRLPRLYSTFAETTRWAQILKCQNLADLNEMIEKKGLREFIRVNEALHEKSISEIADQFVKSGARLILIAGPSSSGKTTFAHRLTIQLKVRGLTPIKVSMDDYYRDHSETPLDENGEPDYERVDALDTALLSEHLARLLKDETVDAPTFDFVTGTRSGVHPVVPLPGHPILVEGIHALNDVLTHDIPRNEKFLIYISALTTLNIDDHNRIRTTDMRLLRRIVRDHLFRGTDPYVTLSMWDSVRRGERNYILPYQESADVMFNSTLLYEPVILKKYGYPLLRDISPDNPNYTRAHRLLKFLNYVSTADVEDEIPVNSILREFIGGCCFYREVD
ncbi:MAG: nucleoside kinase [Clostridia bacterium]|nr:nucleoside kinase [Clostridia bacterium]